MNELNTLILFAEFISKLSPTKAEVVIHDVKKGKIIWIKNGDITNRQVGDDYETSAIKLLYKKAKQSENPYMLVGYQSRSTTGRPLRSSNLFIQDENKELAYAICVNEDMSTIYTMYDYCNNLLMSNVSEFVYNQPVEIETIETITMNVILDEIERAKPFSLDSRESKLTIIKSLNEKGIFGVRYASEKVCELLQIATPTLYKYLKEIKNES